MQGKRRAQDIDRLTLQISRVLLHELLGEKKRDELGGSSL